MSFILEQALGGGKNNSYNKNILGGLKPSRYIGKFNSGLRKIGNFANKAYNVGKYIQMDNPVYNSSMDVLARIGKMGDNKYNSYGLLKSVY